MHPAEQIAVIIKRIYRSGMTTTSGGNLSIRDDNGDIWITPSAIDKGTLKPSDMIRVTESGEIIGPHKPSSEYPFHRRGTYVARSDMPPTPAPAARSWARRFPRCLKMRNTRQ